METLEENKQKECYLQSLSNGSTRAAATEAANTCTSTVWNWRQRDEEFKKAEQIALESRVDVVVDELYLNAAGEEYKDKVGNKHKRRGNVIAQIFYLKNRGKGKWKDKSEIEIQEIKTIKIKAFIQAGAEPVIEEEEPEKEIEENDQGDSREDVETVL